MRRLTLALFALIALTATLTACESSTTQGHHWPRTTGYNTAWQRHARQAITNHRNQHGDTCPGWNRPAHPIHPDQWVCDHDIGPLCRLAAAGDAARDAARGWQVERLQSYLDGEAK